MGTESKSLRDLIYSVITGNTITTNLTATDLIRTVMNSAGNALNINIGGGSGGSVTFPGDVNIKGNLSVTGTTYEVDEYVTNVLYLGPKDTDGSWRLVINGTNLNVEKRVTGSWEPKGQFIGS